jgi:serine/threonine-protein kinase
VVIANGVAYVASMRHRGVLVAASTLAVVIVPVILQAIGAVPPWYTFDGGGLRIVPWMANLPEGPTLAFLTITNAVVITACLVFVSRLRRSAADAERRLRVQAYQLAQIAR